MFVANRYQVIKDYEGVESVSNEMIEKLDEMLTEYGVQHFFTLPEGDENGIAINDDEIVYLYYDADKDEMTFGLVYMLWAKTVRKVSDERLAKAMKKFADKLEK